MNYHDDYELQLDKEILDMMAKVSDDILNKAANMMMDGCTDGEIQNTLGISKSSIYRYRRDGILPGNGHHVAGKTFVPAKVKLPEIKPGHRMDGTPGNLANLPYKETPDTEIPFSDIDDAWNAEDVDVPTTPVEVDTSHNTPETACKPEIAVSEADKGKSKGKAKLARQTTLRGVYVTCEIIDDVVSFTVNGFNGGADTAEVTVADIDNLIGELEEVKMALTAGVY